MIRILKSFQIHILRIIACMLDSCVSLFLEIVFSHKIVGVLIFIRICNFATRMSICSFFLTALSRVAIFERDIRLIGLEPMTPRLSSACSNQLSYSRVDVEGKDRDAHREPDAISRGST